jgi:hypothetical protein
VVRDLAIEDQAMSVRRGRMLAVVVVALLTSAHVGSPDTYFEGRAGPYPIRVIVRTPGVIPGLAEITVRLLAPPAAPRVLVVPVFWDPRTAAPPPPDVAQRVPGDSTLYSASLWLMRYGAYSVQVRVESPSGDGTALVPINAIATRRLPLPAPLAILLGALAGLLFAGAVTLVTAAVRESVLDPGVVPTVRRKRVARIAGAAGGVLLALALLGGRAWWNAVDAQFRTGLYRPLHATTTVTVTDKRSRLELTIDDPVWNDPRRPPAQLVPDHGHLMHLFLVRDSGLAGFAHLHPTPVGSATFETAAPPLPAGDYRVYADIVLESGFSQTLVSSVRLSLPRSTWKPSDADDSWLAHGQAGADTAALADGSTMIWERGGEALVVNREAPLRFVVRAPDGTAATLEPYMGMPGHLMIARDDGAVFVHLHPAGTISLAAEQTFLSRQPGDTVPGALARRLGAAHEQHGSDPAYPATTSFPYAFPMPGRYRLWVQVKRGGRILTGVFDTEVRVSGRTAP